VATSGTIAFQLDVLDIIEEAYERAGLEARSGYDFRTARRSLDLLADEWSNRGLNLWTVAQGSVTLVAGTATYTLPSDTIDLIETQLRVVSGTTTTDYALNRVSVSDYASLSNKASAGRPLQVLVSRTATPTITLWPVPTAADTLIYWRMRRMQDTGTASSTPDIPGRFRPALIAGLAYQIAMKRPEVTDRVPMLQAEYERQFGLASDEDRDRASVFLVPFLR
jgi:hypothetical protein